MCCKQCMLTCLSGATLHRYHLGSWLWDKRAGRGQADSWGPADWLGAISLPGRMMEVFARRALWDVGLNYGHGTGHGIGNFLCVHECKCLFGTSLSSPPPTSCEGDRTLHRYGNDRDPQRCSDPPRVNQLVGGDAPQGKWEILTPGHSCCLLGIWEGLRERSGRSRPSGWLA